jgi:hypothetical protein
MNEHQQRELAAGLKALAESTRAAAASPHVEQVVLAAARPSASRRKPQPWAKLLPLAAGLVLMTGAALWTARMVPPAPPSPIEPAGFVALPEAAGLPQIESANIVRVSLPVAALPAYGVAVTDLKTESVEAELLVAQDGQARAIRLVTDSSD